MVRPPVAARVEQRCYVARVGIQRCEIRALTFVAKSTGQGEILDVVGSAMLPGDDMIDLVCDQCNGFGQEAVLTARAGPLAHQVSLSGRDRH
jgi:hypothetical protein